MTSFKFEFSKVESVPFQSRKRTFPKSKAYLSKVENVPFQSRKRNLSKVESVFQSRKRNLSKVENVFQSRKRKIINSCKSIYYKCLKKLLALAKELIALFC